MIILRILQKVMNLQDGAAWRGEYKSHDWRWPEPMGPTMRVRRDGEDTLYVCKTCSKSLIGDLDRQELFLTRIKKLRELNLPFVVPYIDVIESDNYFFLIREFISSEPILNFVSKRDGGVENSILAIWPMLVETLRQLHANGILLSPLRPQNIFIKDEKSILITDLYEFGPHSISVLKTPDPMQWGFSAPEYFDGSCVPGAHSDVWSLGVLLLYVKWSCLPWRTNNICAMVKTLAEWQGYCPKNADDLIELMAAAILVKDVKTRPSIEVCKDTERLRALGKKKLERV